MTVPWRGVFPAATTEFHPDQSLGVVAVTLRHADRIRQVLAQAVEQLDRPSDGQALRFLDADRSRPVEVVALDEVHGLARDVVILAVGYVIFSGINLSKQIQKIDLVFAD